MRFGFPLPLFLHSDLENFGNAVILILFSHLWDVVGWDLWHVHLWLIFHVELSHQVRRLERTRFISDNLALL